MNSPYDKTLSWSCRFTSFNCPIYIINQVQICCLNYYKVPYLWHFSIQTVETTEARGPDTVCIDKTTRKRLIKDTKINLVIQTNFKRRMKGIKAARFNNRNWKNLKCQSRDCTNNKRCVSYRYQNPWQMDEKIRYSYCNPMFAEGGFTCYCLYFEKHWHFRCQLESQKVNVIDDNNSNNINSNNELVNIKVRFIDILKLFINILKLPLLLPIKYQIITRPVRSFTKRWFWHTDQGGSCYFGFKEVPDRKLWLFHFLVKTVSAWKWRQRQAHYWWYSYFELIQFFPWPGDYNISERSFDKYNAYTKYVGAEK